MALRCKYCNGMYTSLPMDGYEDIQSNCKVCPNCVRRMASNVSDKHPSESLRSWIKKKFKMC